MHSQRDGHDVGARMVIAVVLMAAVIAVTMRVLFLDLDTRDGTVPAPHVVVFTPSTYGPPEAR